VTQAAIAAQGDARCPDFNGGGPDNAFAGVGLIVNPTIVTAIEMQMMNLLPVTIGLLPGEVAASFSLVLFDGAPEGAAYRVSAEALDATGEPVNELPATLVNGEMSAGPASFSVSIPINNIPTHFRLTNAQTRGRPTVDAAGGLSVTGGVISGQLSQPDLDAAFSVLPPEQAALIPVAIQPDLDTNGDGTAESYSICLTFEATPATVLGYPR